MANDTNDLEQQNKIERDRLLHSIFTRQAKAIDNLLATTPPEKLKASMLQSITQFLRLSDVSAETIPDADEDTRETRELGDLVRELTEEGEAQEREDAATLAAGGKITSNTSPQSEPFDKE